MKLKHPTHTTKIERLLFLNLIHCCFCVLNSITHSTKWCSALLFSSVHLASFAHIPTASCSCTLLAILQFQQLSTISQLTIPSSLSISSLLQPFLVLLHGPLHHKIPSNPIFSPSPISTSKVPFSPPFQLIFINLVSPKTLTSLLNSYYSFKYAVSTHRLLSALLALRKG